MAILDKLITGAVVYFVVGGICIGVMAIVRPRWLAWIIDAIVLLAATWFAVGSAIALSAGYSGGPYLSDLIVISPLPVVLIALTFVSTRPRWRRPDECECGYDLTGNESGVWPECGARIDEAKRSPAGRG